MKLARPLSKLQVRAAGQLHAKLEQWRLADNALELVRIAFPGFGPEASLVKVATLNQLYGTRLYAVTRMALHVSKLLGAGRGPATAELVDRIAALPAPHGKTERRHLSFAAKFAHFFLDAERFPIFDSHAARMLRFHSGRGFGGEKNPTYVQWVGAFDELRAASGIAMSRRELDQYLWLAGLRRAWQKNAKDEINVEVRALWESTDKAIQNLAAELLGTD